MDIKHNLFDHKQSLKLTSKKSHFNLFFNFLQVCYKFWVQFTTSSGYKLLITLSSIRLVDKPNGARLIKTSADRPQKADLAMNNDLLK